MDDFSNFFDAKRRKIDSILRPLILSDVTVNKIQATFKKEMNLGLMGDPSQKSSLQMENTFIPELCNGKEKGDFLALDLGGTNFRVILLRLQPGKEADELVKYYTVPEKLRLGKGEPLFDFLAACIYDFMNANCLLGKKLPLGFCFSFPMIQKGLKSGFLVTWTKSFNCPDAVGKDAVELLTSAIKKRGDINVDVCAVVNDTTGTLMKGAYVDHRCAIGLILGTGCNGCYLEKASRIQKWKGMHEGINEVVVDVEWGAFGDNGVLDFMKTEFDKLVDEESLIVHSFTFEKMFAGKYIGDLCRHIIKKIIKDHALLGGSCPKMLEVHNSLTAADVSDIVSDDGNLPNTQKIFARLGVGTISVNDAYVIKEVCCIVSARGALLVSICLATLLDRMDKDFVTIAVDGSLYKQHPFFHDLMAAYIAELAPSRKFTLILAEDGSGKGAGLVAAVVNRLESLYDISQLHA